MEWYLALSFLLGMILFFMFLGVPVALAFLAANMVGATYFMAPTSKFSMNVSAGLGYRTDSVGDVDVNTLSFAVSPGFNYWIADSWGLVANIAALSYTSSEVDVEGAEAATGFGLNLDLSDINFGMVYKF